MSEGFANISAVKSKLTPWREIVLVLNQVLSWEKPFFPGVIAGSTSLIYLILYCMDMSNLTLIPLLIALTLLADFCVPLVAAKVFDASKWSPAQEKQFEGICGCIASITGQVGSVCEAICETKKKSPKVFLAGALSITLVLSYLGTILNGFFALWAITLTVLMIPGLKQRGALDKVIQMVLSKTKSQ